MQKRYVMDLAGEWRFAMDPNEKGTNMCGGWYEETLPDTVILPGTTSSNFKGIESKVIDKLGVIEKFTCRGAAWYQKEVDIPLEWADKHVELVLERANNTTVWLDNILVGRSDYLQTDQIFDLTNIAAPGKHTITVRNDNSRVRPTHCYRFDFINGICGEITLTATDRVYVAGSRITPNIPNKSVVVYMDIANQTGCEVRGDLFINVHTTDGSHVLRPIKYEYLIEYNRTEKEFEMEIWMGDDIKLWDEFSPNLYEMEVKLTGRAGARTVNDYYSERFGMREFTRRGTQFAINGKTIILRGDALLHEKYMYRTGRSLYSKKDWIEMLNVYKEYGINYLRFHTHCPPKAVFEAADEVGIYMQPELTLGGTNGMNIPAPDSPMFDPLLEPVIKRLGKAEILWLYNHPSFVMLTLGNEINGDRDFLERMVEYLRSVDPTRLYAQGSNNFIRSQSQSVNDDFWSTMKVKPQWNNCPVRGSFAHNDPPLGPVQDNEQRNSLRDHYEAIKDIPVPVIAFELGQYETTCNFDEIERFPDFELPGSMMRYKKIMEQSNLIHREKDFYKASGAAALLCYREDIEMIMRTKGMGGFQILSLGDIHTDGTAIDGILNGFMESKGMVSSRVWRNYCSEHAVLLRIGKFVFNDGEQADMKIQFANYGPETIHRAKPYLEIRDGEKALAKKTFDAVDLPQGALTDIADTSMTMNAEKPAQYVLRAGIENHDFYNDYHIWIYPPAEVRKTVYTTCDCKEAAEMLKAGKNVLLYSDVMSGEKCVEGFFATNFWSFDMFVTASRNCWESRPGMPGIGTMTASGTMGISYDPAHPVFRYFPGDGHSDYQWFNIVMNGYPVILDTFDSALEPIIWVIDTPHRCHKIGLVFEIGVGEGKLMVCTTKLADLNEDRPAQNLLKGIYEYMNSDAFDPKVKCSIEHYEKFFAGDER